MNQIGVLERFGRIYLGDSLLQYVELRIAEAECRLVFNGGKILKSEAGSIFEPEAQFSPCVLHFLEVRSISCGGPRFELNSTVIDFSASVSRSQPEYLDFCFELTGGTSADAFVVKLKFEAKEFRFGSV